MISGVLQFLYLAVGILFFVSFSGGRKGAQRPAFFLGAAILSGHFLFLFFRSLEAGRPPLTNMFETLHLLAFLIFFLFFIARLRWPIDLVGGFAGLTAALLIASSAITSPEIEPLLPALKSNWLLFHVTACFIAYSGLGLAMGTALAYLAVHWFGMGNLQHSAREDVLKKLDRMTHQLILFGYPLLTLGIATGSVWAELSWGRYWNWDPKETWAFATWLFYGAWLHLRLKRKHRPVLAAVLAVLAFSLVLFTYYGVNVWLSTLHDYS